MTYKPSRIEISIPTASGDGRFYGRYPHGNAPINALAGTPSDTTSAAGNLKTPLAGAASDSTSAAATLTVGSSALSAAAADTTSAGAYLQLQITSSASPSGAAQYQPFAFQPTAAGGVPPVSWSFSGNLNPAGGALGNVPQPALVCNWAQGFLSSPLPDAITSSGTLTATDSVGNVATQSVSITASASSLNFNFNGATNPYGYYLCDSQQPLAPRYAVYNNQWNRTNSGCFTAGYSERSWYAALPVPAQDNVASYPFVARGVYKNPPIGSFTLSNIVVNSSTSITATISDFLTTNPFNVGGTYSFIGVSGMTQVNGVSGTATALSGSDGAWTVTLTVSSTSGWGTFASGGGGRIGSAAPLGLQGIAISALTNAQLHCKFDSPRERNAYDGWLLGDMYVYPIATPNGATKSNGQIATITVGGSGGSGYTNGTHTGIALSGGSGYGAIATVVVSGGSVQSVTVTGYGTTTNYSYVVGDTLTIASGIGSGTGATYTVASISTVNYPLINILFQPSFCDTYGAIQFNIITNGVPNTSPTYSSSYAEADNRMWFYEWQNSDNGYAQTSLVVWPAPWNDSQQGGAQTFTLNYEQFLKDVIANWGLSGLPITTSSYVCGVAVGWETAAGGPSWNLSAVSQASSGVIQYSSGEQFSVTGMARETGNQTYDHSGNAWLQITFNSSASANPYLLGTQIILSGTSLTGLNGTPLYVTSTGGSSGAWTVGVLAGDPSQYSGSLGAGGYIDVVNPLSVGQLVTIQGVTTMTQLNTAGTGIPATVTAVSGTTSPYSATLNVNTSAFTAYGSGGGTVGRQLFRMLDFQTSFQSEAPIFNALGPTTTPITPTIPSVRPLPILWSRHLNAGSLDSAPYHPATYALTADFQNKSYYSSGTTPSSSNPLGIMIDISGVSSTLKSSSYIHIHSGGYRCSWYATQGNQNYTLGTFTIDVNTTAPTIVSGAATGPTTGWVTLKTFTAPVTCDFVYMMGNISAYNALRIRCTAPAPNAYGSGQTLQLNVDCFYINPNAITESNPYPPGILSAGDSINNKCSYFGWGEDGGAADYFGQNLFNYVGAVVPFSNAGISGWALAANSYGYAYPPFLPWMQGIYGPLTFAGPLSAGASSAPLAAPWPNPTSIYAVTLDTGQSILMTLTNGSSNATNFTAENLSATTVSTATSTAIGTMHAWFDEWGGDTMTLALGTNDSAAAVTQTQFETALTWLCNRAIAIKKTLIVESVLFNAGNSGGSVFSGYIASVLAGFNSPYVRAGLDRYTMGAQLMNAIFDQTGPEAGGLHPGVLGQPIYRGIRVQYYGQNYYNGLAANDFVMNYSEGVGF